MGIGTVVRNSVSRFAFISGIVIQPNAAPTHHTGSVCPNARKKFSVLMEIRSVLQITRTRLLGAGEKVEITLPISMVMPVTALITPSENSLPPLRDSSIAGRAAL